MTPGQLIGPYELVEPLPILKAEHAWAAFDKATGLIVAIESLDSALARGPLRAEIAATIAVRLLQSLHRRQHEGHVYHAVAPQNILIGDNGANVFLADAAPIPPGRGAYRSPEESRGFPTSPRSEIYSVGCVLYAMLTGAPPALGSDPPEPPSSRHPGLSPSLDSIVLKALRVDPEERFGSCAEFIHAVRSAVSSPAGMQISRGGPQERYQELVELKYDRGLSPAEQVEMERLDQLLSDAEEDFYAPILQRLARHGS